jgi:proline iminopeptidase
MEKDDYTFAEKRIKVSDGFELYVQDWGNPHAKTPIIFLKGGPGGACKQRDKDGFDPARDRVIFFDQRGCGQSKPYGKLEANTTAHMIQDINAIADYFGLQKFALRGTSWGSCLALAYALEHPERVAALFSAYSRHRKKKLTG